MFQSTMYAGHGYGSRKSDVEAILAKGKHVMTTMDISGAMSLKTNFPNVTTIYIQRDKKALLRSILRKNSSIDDKLDRILAVEPELKNAEICDYVIEFDRYDDAVKQLRNILGV
jgi:guanylate kinase